MLCTYFAITRKGSFEDVSLAVLLTGPGRKDFPQASRTGLKQRLLEPFSASRLVEAPPERLARHTVPDRAEATLQDAGLSHPSL